jgi:sec-independent protein translocase protein TatB
MKDTMESAARDVEQTIQTSASDFEKSWSEATDTASQLSLDTSHLNAPEYRHPKKHWRLKKGATPSWYKARAGVRTKALSGAARVARFRPPKIS